MGCDSLGGASTFWARRVVDLLGSHRCREKCRGRRRNLCDTAGRTSQCVSLKRTDWTGKRSVPLDWAFHFHHRKLLRLCKYPGTAERGAEEGSSKAKGQEDS